MIIYNCALLWILLVGMVKKKKDIVVVGDREEYHTKWFHAFLTVFFLIFFIGLRSAGADTETYIGGYYQLPTGFHNALSALKDEEGLFKAFGILVKTCAGENYHPYLFLIALISGWALTDTVRKHTPHFTSAMVLFMLAGEWTWMINGIRQFFAVTLAFAAVDLILERKLFKYIIVILLLSKIHLSAIMLLPVYFLVSGKAFSKKTLIMLAVAVFAIFSTTRFIDFLGITFESTSYGSILEGQYFNADDGSNVLRTVIFAVPVLFSIVERKNIEENAPPIIHLCVNMSIICVCISAIANVTSGIYFGRLPIYFSVYNLLLLPWLANHTKLFANKWIINGLMFGLYGLYYIYSYYIHGSAYYVSDALNLYIF